MKEKIAKARVKEPSEVDPQLFCCDLVRTIATEWSGKVIYIYPNRRYRRLIICEGCGAESEVQGVRLVNPKDHRTCISTLFIDIDEGS